jgi:hypothetical protein
MEQNNFSQVIRVELKTPPSKNVQRMVSKVTETSYMVSSVDISSSSTSSGGNNKNTQNSQSSN